MWRFRHQPKLQRPDALTRPGASDTLSAPRAQAPRTVPPRPKRAVHYKIRPLRTVHTSRATLRQPPDPTSRAREAAGDNFRPPTRATLSSAARTGADSVH
ncbi:MAG: hypothetical protein ACYTDW_09300 [Planctomycetota bacterium]